MGAGAVSILFINVSSASSREPGTQWCSKTFAINNIITIMEIIISAHSSVTMVQREAAMT